MAGALPINGGGMKAALSLRDSRPRNRPRYAGGPWPQRRAVGADRGRRAGRVRHMRLFPRVGFVLFVGRGHVDGVVKPAVPARRRRRRLGYAVIDDPPPLEAERGIDSRLAVIGVAELVMAHQLAEASGVEPGVEIRAVPPGEIVQQKFLEPIRHGVAPFSYRVIALGLSAADYGEAGVMRQAELCPPIAGKNRLAGAPRLVGCWPPGPALTLRYPRYPQYVVPILA